MWFGYVSLRPQDKTQKTIYLLFHCVFYNMMWDPIYNTTITIVNIILNNVGY